MEEVSGGVRDFYAGKVVFITGATGYLGKATVEKLLRSCPEISKVYLLVRLKKGKSPRDRLSELLDSSVFDRLKEEYPGFESKIVLVPGDVEQAGLGISDSDASMVTNDTSVVIHNAATINFQETLKRVVKVNVVGLQQVVHLAKRMENLQAFVHVSTAFSNCVNSVIEEKLYPQRMTPHQMISACSWMSDEEMKLLQPHILQDYPNAYAFSKCLGELLLEEERGNIPAAIIRPTIVVSSHSDPFPGWIDSQAGANALIALQGQGVLRKMLGSNSIAADLVPVDFSVNSAIVAGWKLAVDKPKDILIVNMSSGQLNPILWKDMLKYGAEHQYNSPSKTVVRPPAASNVFTTKLWIRNLSKVTNHYVPAAILDFISRIKGETPMYMRSVRGLWRFAAVAEYFTCNKWVFANKNLTDLYRSVPPVEKKIFNFDMKSINWSEFCRDWWLGTRKYIWREDMSKQLEYNRRFARICRRSRIIKISAPLLLLVAIIGR